MGATLAATGTVLWDGILQSVILPMILSPLVGFGLGYLVMLAVMWLFRRGQPSKLNRGFRLAQTVSAAAMSIVHGMQDAAKTIGIIVLALYVGGYQGDAKAIPEWAFWTSGRARQRKHRRTAWPRTQDRPGARSGPMPLGDLGQIGAIRDGRSTHADTP